MKTKELQQIENRNKTTKSQNIKKKKKKIPDANGMVIINGQQEKNEGA